MQTLKRFEDWPKRLEVYFKNCEGLNFSYGQFDCCLFAAGAVNAITGQDFAKGIRGHYSDKESGDTVFKNFGVSDAAGLVDFMGFPQLPSPRFAQRGDVVAMETEEGMALGIVTLDGRHFNVVTPIPGVSRVPLRAAARAWRV